MKKDISTEALKIILRSMDVLVGELVYDERIIFLDQKDGCEIDYAASNKHSDCNRSLWGEFEVEYRLKEFSSNTKFSHELIKKLPTFSISKEGELFRVVIPGSAFVPVIATSSDLAVATVLAVLKDVVMTKFNVDPDGARALYPEIFQLEGQCL